MQVGPHELYDVVVLHDAVEGVAGVDLEEDLLVGGAHQEAAVDEHGQVSDLVLGQLQVVIAGDHLTASRPYYERLVLFEQGLDVG